MLSKKKKRIVVGTIIFSTFPYCNSRDWLVPEFSGYGGFMLCNDMNPMLASSYLCNNLQLLYKLRSIEFVWHCTYLLISIGTS